MWSWIAENWVGIIAVISTVLALVAMAQKIGWQATALFIAKAVETSGSPGDAVKSLIKATKRSRIVDRALSFVGKVVDIKKTTPISVVTGLLKLFKR